MADISLTKSEKSDLMAYYTGYSISEDNTLTEACVSRKCRSTGRIARCIEHADGSVEIRQIVDSMLFG